MEPGRFVDCWRVSESVWAGGAGYCAHLWVLGLFVPDAHLGGAESKGRYETEDTGVHLECGHYCGIQCVSGNL